MDRAINMLGFRSGRLEVIARDTNKRSKTAWWICRCDCGNIISTTGNNLRTGHTKSCGCARKENTAKHLKANFTKHGGANSRLYGVWQGMKKRVNDPHNCRYHCYGGRGIKICDEWLDFATFREWALSTGYDESAPYGECTIDRIDVDGNYEPSNCRWICLAEQAKNKRKRGNHGKALYANAECNDALR